MNIKLEIYLQTVGVNCLTIIGGSLTGALGCLGLAVTFKIKVLVASPSLQVQETKV